ncbi:hypothetical protein PQO01_05385 [Lentisphaera marina]|uniref:hypothetical protein n=1 Tax=Lentisphaera marina TaxID=1111041 RepID=UPI0023655678|nr:hypothetical protein [Lentisphaera marina]MDD7984379.1 hypothetical protein [Lentisphaera marina]
MSDSVRSIEREIESQNFKCRIYTAGRIAAAGGSVFTGVLGVVGAASAIGIAAHNLATYDPDFEIKKHKIDKAITVAYMR